MSTKKNFDEPVDHREAGLGKEFLKKVADRQACNLAKKAAEACEKELSQEIAAMVAETGYKTVMTPDWRVTFTAGSNTSISKQKLLDQGVSVKVIQKATNTTTWETVTVTAVKQ